MGRAFNWELVVWADTENIDQREERWRAARVEFKRRAIRELQNIQIAP
jgi:hypothetical protein